MLTFVLVLLTYLLAHLQLADARRADCSRRVILENDRGKYSPRVQLVAGHGDL